MYVDSAILRLENRRSLTDSPDPFPCGKSRAVSSACYLVIKDRCHIARKSRLLILFICASVSRKFLKNLDSLPRPTSPHAAQRGGLFSLAPASCQARNFTAPQRYG